MNNNEQKAHDFLNYIVKNESELKRALAKNITYDKEIFDDAFQDTIIKVYNSIKKNGTDIADYKHYIFTSLKWTYALADNRNKKKKNNSIRDYFTNNDIMDEDTAEQEERFEMILDTLQDLREMITEEYGELYASVFFDYYSAKTTEGCSYKKLSAKLGITVKEITTIIKTIREYISTNEKIKHLKDVLNAHN